MRKECLVFGENIWCFLCIKQELLLYSKSHHSPFQRHTLYQRWPAWYADELVEPNWNSLRRWNNVVERSLYPTHLPASRGPEPLRNTQLTLCFNIAVLLDCFPINTTPGWQSPVIDYPALPRGFYCFYIYWNRGLDSQQSPRSLRGYFIKIKVFLLQKSFSPKVRRFDTSPAWQLTERHRVACVLTA